MLSLVQGQFTSDCILILLGNKSDWMRIGAFSFDSEVAFLSQRMSASVKIPKQENIDDMLQSCGSCLLRKIKTGIWIAGTVQIL